MQRFLCAPEHSLALVKALRAKCDPPENDHERGECSVLTKGRKALGDLNEWGVESKPIRYDPSRRYDSCVYNTEKSACRVVIPLQHDWSLW
jgi:hypothetical protein